VGGFGRVLGSARRSTHQGALGRALIPRSARGGGPSCPINLVPVINTTSKNVEVLIGLVVHPSKLLRLDSVGLSLVSTPSTHMHRTARHPECSCTNTTAAANVSQFGRMHSSCCC
jgi:hypothetical protein